MVACYTLRPFPLPVACCCVLLGDCCAKFETGQTFRCVQTDATTPNNAASCCQQCCPFTRGLRPYIRSYNVPTHMKFELEVQLKRFHVEVNISLACSLIEV